MLFYIACAFAAFAAARILAGSTHGKLNALWIVPASSILGVIAGVTLFSSLLPIFGHQLDKSSLPAMAARALLQGLLAAGIGFWLTKKNSTTCAEGGKPQAFGAMASRSMLRLYLSGLVAVVFIILGFAYTNPPAQLSPVATEIRAPHNLAANAQISEAKPEPSEAEIHLAQDLLTQSHPSWRDTVNSTGFSNWLESLPVDRQQQYLRSVTAPEFAAFLDAYERHLGSSTSGSGFNSPQEINWEKGLLTAPAK